MGSPPRHMPGTLLDHPAPALTRLKPSRQEGSFRCFTPGAFLRPRIPSFSPHWTNPSLQPPRMALSSESPSTPPLLPLRVPTVSPFLEMKCLPRPSPALVYTSLRPGSGLMMKECIISEPTAPWHLPVTSSEGPRTVAPLPLPRPPGHLGGRTEQPRASLRPSLTASPTSSPRPQPISSRPPGLCASCHTPSHPKHHQQTPLHPVTLSSDHAPPPSWVCTVVPLHPLNGPVFSYIPYLWARRWAR